MRWFRIGGPLSWLMVVNFVVLQWFGMRLCRMTTMQYTNAPDGNGLIADVVTRWSILRWVVPLTGWWQSYVWIANRSRWVSKPDRRISQSHIDLKSGQRFSTIGMQTTEDTSRRNARDWVATASGMVIAAWHHCGCDGCVYCDAVAKAIKDRDR